MKIMCKKLFSIMFCLFVCKQVARKWPQNQHVPPEDIGANFYPELGCYSSRDPVVIDEHMQQFKAAGIGKRGGGAREGRVPPKQQKFCVKLYRKKRKKVKEKIGKRNKNWEERHKWGRFFHFCHSCILTL